MSLLKYCETAAQRQVVEMIDRGMTKREASEQIGISERAVFRRLQTIKRIAAAQGWEPESDLTHPAATGFATKRVSTAYNTDGDIVLQWHIQEPERQKLDELISQFVSGFKDEVAGLHVPVKLQADCDDDYLVGYVLGDHHLGMLADAKETNAENYDVSISQKLLEGAIDRLVGVAPSASIGVLVNLGDFMHVNDSTSTTPNSKNLLDSDGRYSKTIRAASNLIKRCIIRMLQKHEQVWILNVRGNHDPDAALWLNEVMRLYFEDNPRVKVFDNASKFMWFQFGKNLIVTHHGDKIKMANLYGSITKNLRKEWGESDHVFVWTGHIHHKNQEEHGGALFESFNILAPADAWHAASGYSSSRSMSCIVLHKDYGEEGRLKVNTERINERN